MNIDQIVQDFFTTYTKVQYIKGEILLRAGDPPLGALYIQSGFVRMSVVNQEGDMLVLHVFRAGSIIPMPWIINDTPNTYYYEALTAVEIRRSPREDVLKFFRDHPDMEHAMLSRMVHGLSGLMKRMEFLVFDTAYKKTVLLLLYFAKQFSDANQKGTLLIPLTHKEIAAWIGTTRETASLQIEALKEKNLISYTKRAIVIPNIVALQKETDTSDDVV